MVTLLAAWGAFAAGFVAGVLYVYLAYRRELEELDARRDALLEDALLSPPLASAARGVDGRRVS